MVKGSETHRSALRSDRTKAKLENDADDETVAQAEETEDSGVISEPPSLSLLLSLSSDLKPVCTDRLGMVNCGMLSGVRIFGKIFSWESKDFAVPVAHESTWIPALLCLRPVGKSSEALLPLQIAPMVNVLVTGFLFMFKSL